MTQRPSWNEYFIQLTNIVATRSTCLRRQVGSIIVKDKRIIATGYNGVPTGNKHCSETGCLREKLNIPSSQQHELCKAVHSEQNAIIQAAKYGISIKDSTLFCTHQPCNICAKMIINAGISAICFKEPYNDPLTIKLLKSNNIEIIELEKD